MMESSEQQPDDSSFGSERIVVTSYEDYAREVMPMNQDNDQANEQVLGYLDKENATLVLESQRIELDGKRLILAQGPGDEIFFFVSSEQEPSSEQALSQSISENADNIHTLAIQCGLNNLGAVSSEGIQVIERSDGLQNIGKNGTLYIEQAHEPACIDSDNNRHSSEALGYHGQEEDDTTEMVFIPTTSQVISLSNNTGLLHLAGVVHPTSVTSKLHAKEEIECARKISEGSVIVSQTHADSYSSKVEDVGVSAVNKEDSNNSLHDEHMAFEIETSMLSMPPRDIDHAVSVYNATASNLVHDQVWRTKNIQENKSQTEETGQPDLKLPAVSTKVTYLECSNFKESLDSELFSESLFIEESSKHSDLKGSTDSSNKDDNANCETSATVEKTVDKDTNESINFPPQLPSSENIVDDYSKWKDSINCNNNDSNTSVVDVDLSHNLDNKIFYPSSKSCENEMDFTNPEEACSEIQTCSERTFLSLGDNSESKSSFFSDNSQSKDCNLHILKKMKSVSPSKVKKVIDEYDFENSSSNLDQELSHNSSLGRQPSDMANSDDASTEVDATKVSHSVNSELEDVTGNLTFQGILTPVTDITKLDENRADSNNSETYYDNSQYLFDQSPEHKEEHSSSEMLKSTNVKFLEDKQNSVFSEVNHTDENKKSAENILAVKNSVNIDNKSKEIDSVFLNVAASDEITVKPPQRTYIRKKRTFDSGRNIELFSLDDFSDNEPYPTPKIFCLDSKKEQTMMDEYSLADEDGYVNLMPSNVKNRIKTKSTSPVDERAITLSPQSSDHLEKSPDPVMDAEDSVSTCCDVDIDNKSKENDSVFSNLAAYDETIVQPPQRTYARKKKTSDFVRNIELFSFDDLSDNEPYLTSKFFCLDSEKEQIMIDEDSLVDEDGYVNLMPSNVKNRIKAKSTPPVDERTITLSPQSSDHLEKIPDPVIDAEDSANICCGTYLIETSFKPTNTEKTEGNAPKASSPDVPKVESPRSSFKKRVQTPSYEKISAKIDSCKSGQLWDMVIKSSPIRMKDASSDKSKIREKVKKQIEKTLRNSKNFNRAPISMAHLKKGQPSVDGKKSENILRSPFSSPENVKICGIRFLNDNSTEKNNSCGIDELSTPSTSTQELKNFQYTCSNCNFVSNKVNNLIMHLKYCEFKHSVDMTDFQIYSVKRKQQIHSEFSESFSADIETSSSQNFSNASVILDEFTTRHPTNSEVLHMASDSMPNTRLSVSTKPLYHQ